jgi:hypothetical protein
MALPIVNLIPGTEVPIGEGVTAPVRCLVRFADHSCRAAVLKRMASPSVAAEAFCALLLRSWGLAVPEPAIVDGNPLAFASIDSGYPNLKQRIGWSDALPESAKAALATYGAKLVAGFGETPLALAADEAIDNRDRNLGNILWDGSNVAWIDHERAFGLGGDSDANKLAIMAVMSGDHVGIQKAAIALSLTLGTQAISESLLECASLGEATGFASFVSSRLASLASRVLNRFPQPADLLNPGGPTP